MDKRSEDVAALALRWLESVNAALLVVDIDLEIHWANRPALDWLDAKDPVSCVGQQLHLGRSQQRLRALLEAADKDFHGICLPLSDRRAHLIVAARRITPEGEPGFYGLTFRNTGNLDL
ncbi:MAG TPA: PAS domain-containing protein, partial [Sphingomicrobium sp.]|nr:PAS domain-containing protein [Sphingomicrobium sp.]